MTNYYPLTAAQKMHHNWIMDYGTQQVSGVSVVASVQAELDFGLLKKCIQMETERSGCTRIRFTKPDKDGNVQQYLVKTGSKGYRIQGSVRNEKPCKSRRTDAAVGIRNL